MIEQIRHLQSQQPFETFAIELGNGCVIQIHDRHQVATTEFDRRLHLAGESTGCERSFPPTQATTGGHRSLV
jgi:hypothetical protein